jgi:hypothetical protein
MVSVSLSSVASVFIIVTPPPCRAVSRRPDRTLRPT